MELAAKDIFKVLTQKGIRNLHHANSVKTACSFLKSGKLLSRGNLIDLGLSQTNQYTDALDKEHGLWHDVFVDTVNIHDQARRRNLYGPVLFELDLNILEEDWLKHVWVTKSNPSKWKSSMSYIEKYFQSIDDFQIKFNFGDFTKLFILRNIGESLCLKNYLKKIIVDRCDISINGVLAFDQAIIALRESAILGGIANLEIIPHDCHPHCMCKTQYNSMNTSEIKKFYTP